MQRTGFSFVVTHRSYSTGSFNLAKSDFRWRRGGAAFLLLPHPSRIGCRLYANGNKEVVVFMREEPKHFLDQIPYPSGWPRLTQDWFLYDEIEDDLFFSEKQGRQEVLEIIEGGILSYLTGDQILRLGPTLQVCRRDLPIELPEDHLEWIRREVAGLPRDRKERRNLVRSQME